MGSNNASADGGNSTCFLNKYRTFTPASAREQGLKYRQSLGKKFSWGGVAFDIALLISGFGLCFFGYKLVHVMVAATGFTAGLLFTFWGVSSVMSHFTSLYNCWALGLVPVLGALIGVVILKKIERLTFFILGAGIGTCIGYYLYIFIFANLEQSHHWNHDLVNYGSIIVPALVCGAVAVKLEDKILAVATSLIGGIMVGVGFCYVVMVRLPHGENYTAWMHPCMFQENACTEDYKHVDVMSGYVLGPAIGTLVISLLGMVAQFKLQSKKDEYQPIPYGGYSANVQGGGGYQ